MTPAVPSARAGSGAGARTTDAAAAELAITFVPVPDRPAGPGYLLPGLLIAGVTHAGATGLSRALACHPEIKLPVVKRVDHYSPLRFEQPVQATLADYDRRFATWTGQRYRLERSPVYFDGGQKLVDAVAADLPGLRVLMLLRDPVERLWASFRDKVERGRLPQAMSYESYVDRCLALRANDADRFEGNRYFRALSAGMYADHLPAWLEAFGERTRVVFAEDFERSPQHHLDALIEWLGLDPSLTRAAPRMAGYGTDGPEPGWLQTFGTDGASRRHWPALARPGEALRRPAEMGFDLVRRVTRSRVPRQSDRVRLRLERLYAPANQRLAGMLRDLGYADLPHWLDVL
ncbi:MAG: hypothetical protein WAL50_07030 [Kineosporiaceae bacterium]|jgi:hypothetical protein